MNDVMTREGPPQLLELMALVDRVMALVTTATENQAKMANALTALDRRVAVLEANQGSPLTR